MGVVEREVREIKLIVKDIHAKVLFAMIIMIGILVMVMK